MQSTPGNLALLRNSSHMAETLIPSEIIKLASEVNHKIQLGEEIFNLTIGDFNPAIFPIPKELEDAIIKAYQSGHTNYPAANGMVELRKILSSSILNKLGLDYSPDEILVSGGARPLIYAIYKTILDKGDLVLFPVPSWNNNHYCHLSEACGQALEVSAAQNFMPTAADIKPFIEKATLIALCSPQNPTGTVFAKDTLLEICQLVKQENIRRSGNQKPLYIMYDQIYWELTFGDTRHYDPVSLEPALRDYVIYVDGLSKVFAATGVRVGWSFGPKKLIDQMRAILSHIGAWAPKAEQMATASFLQNTEAVQAYLNWFKPEIHYRLSALYDGIIKLKNDSYPIDIINPQAAIYLTVQCPWKGKTVKGSKVLETQQMVTAFILDTCKIAIVPFKAFGSSDDSDWYRISVGTLEKDHIDSIISGFKKGMDQLEDS